MGAVHTSDEIRAAEQRLLDLAARVSAAVIAGLLLFGLIALDRLGISAPPRPADPSRWGGGAAATTGIMILLIAPITAWGVSGYLRCTDGKLRRIMLAAPILTIGFLIIALVRYADVSPTITEACWYLSYVPVGILPHVALYGAIRSSALDGIRAVRTTMGVLLAICIGLIALILTNGLHHLVFPYSSAGGPPGESYAYGPGFIAIALWTLFILGLTGVVLAVKSRSQLRPATLLLLAAIILTIVYSILFIYRFETVSSSNLVLSYLLVFVLATELSLRLGLLPSHPLSRDAFLTLPVRLWVLTSDGDEAYATDEAGPLNPSILAAIEGHEIPQNRLTEIRPDGEPDTVYTVYRVRGGLGVIARDISQINSQRDLLQLMNAQLAQANEFLDDDTHRRLRPHVARGGRRLARELEHTITLAATVVRTMLSSADRGKS